MFLSGYLSQRFAARFSRSQALQVHMVPAGTDTLSMRSLTDSSLYKAGRRLLSIDIRWYAAAPPRAFIDKIMSIMMNSPSRERDHPVVFDPSISLVTF